MKVQKIVNESKEMTGNPLLDELLDFKVESFDLYEAHNGSTVSSNVSKRLKADGYINVRGTEVHSNEDAAIIAKLFRDSRYETFRILYIKDNKVIASEGITSKVPSISNVIGFKPNITSEGERVIYYYNHRIEKLGADGYYLVHNHPMSDSGPSKADYRVTAFFVKNVPGFIAHIIVGEDDYTIFDEDKEITNEYTDEPKQTRDDETELNRPDDVIAMIGRHSNPKNTTIILYCDNHGRLISTEILEDKQFNDKDIFKYIANRKRDEGALNCFLYTSNEDICDKASDYIVLNLFTDVLYEDTPKRVVSIRSDLNQPVDKSYNVLGKKTAEGKRYRVS